MNSFGYWPRQETQRQRGPRLGLRMDSERAETVGKPAPRTLCGTLSSEGLSERQFRRLEQRLVALAVSLVLESSLQRRSSIREPALSTSRAIGQPWLLLAILRSVGLLLSFKSRARHQMRK